MRWILAVGIVVLVAACSQKKDEPTIQYSAPRAPLANETSAAGAATTALAGSLAPLDTAAASQPTYGVPGLADQLAAQLGTTAVAGIPAGSVKLAEESVRQAFDMTQMRGIKIPDLAVVLILFGILSKSATLPLHTYPAWGAINARTRRRGGTLACAR